MGGMSIIAAAILALAPASGIMRVARQRLQLLPGAQSAPPASQPSHDL